MHKIKCLFSTLLLLILLCTFPIESIAANDDIQGSDAEYQSFEELNGKTISMLTGAPFENLISSKVQNVKEFTYFQSAPDMMLAIREGKTDAGLMNNAVADLVANRDEKLTVFPKSLGDTAFGLAFTKGDARRDEWQAVYDNISEDTRKELWEKWTGADDSVKTIPVQDLTKMGDIVRGRTYEAFFPLIAVAVIYFMLGGLLTFVVSRVEVLINPKLRKKEVILKGVRS